MITTLKIRLHPNKKQTTRLFQFAGAARYAYNWVIHQQLAADTFISEGELRKQFTQFKRQPDNKWMYAISNNVMKQAIRDCYKAYDRFFKYRKQGGEKYSQKTLQRLARQGKQPSVYEMRCYPKYKRRKEKQSFYQDTAKIQFTATHVRIELLGGKRKQLCWVKLAESNRIPVDASYYNPRITYDGLRWWVSVGVQIPDRRPIITSYSEPLGIDVGVKELAVVSTGEKFGNVNKTAKVKRLKKKQRRLQRQVSRRYQMNKKGDSYQKTRNIIKSERKLLQFHQRLTNLRIDYIKQTVNKLLSRKPRYVVIEDLNISGMLKNRHLARAIQEQKLYEFRQQLITRSARLSIPVMIASRWYPSSKRCSRCGHLKTDLKLSDRVYRCSQCGLEIDRDYNAALNLRSYREPIRQSR